MKKYFFFIFFLFFFNSTFAEEKIVFLDVNILLTESDAGKYINNELKNINDKNIEEFKKIENSIKSEEEKLLAQKNVLKEEDFKNKVENLKKKYNSYQKMKNIKNNDLKELRNNAGNKLLNIINDITFRRETPTMQMISSSSVKLCELSNGNLAHFGVALNSNSNYRHSYLSTINNSLESIIETKLLIWSDTYTEYVINDAILANMSGEDRFFTTGYNKDEITTDGNTTVTRMLTISSYDIDGNSIFSTNKNVGDMENGKGIILTDANTLLIVGKTKQIVGVYSNINYPLYGNEYGGDNYNFLIHECDPSNNGGTISNGWK